MNYEKLEKEVSMTTNLIVLLILFSSIIVILSAYLSIQLNWLSWLIIHSIFWFAIIMMWVLMFFDAYIKDKKKNAGKVKK